MKTTHTRKHAMNIPIRMLSIVSLIAGLAATAQASTLISPTSSIGSSEIHEKRGVDSVINGAEMSFTGDRNVYSNWTQDAGRDKSAGSHPWGAKGGIDTPWVIIDLGATYNLDTISLWNLNPNQITTEKDPLTSRAASKVNIYYTTTGVGTNTHLNDKVFDSSGWTALGTDLDVTRNPGAATTRNPNLLLSGLAGVQARWVAIEITNTHGNIHVQNKGMISEVQFFAVSEPSTVADNSESSTVVDIPEPSMLGLVIVSGMVALLRRPRAHVA